jgi:hypothetical protein
MTTIKKEDIQNCFEALTDSIDNENMEIYRRVMNGIVIDEITNPEDFYLFVVWPFEKFIDKLVRDKVGNNKELSFIYSNYRFIQRHFESVIKKVEGIPCCADKSRTIINRLVEFCKTGREISFDYEGEYTFHLPKKVFRTHNEIVSFYQSLVGLYYGQR